MREIDFATISTKLKALRMAKGVTQEYVARKADVNTSHISNIENGRVKISLTTLVAVCNALDTTVDYVLSEQSTDASSALDQSILLELQKCDKNTKEKILKIIQILYTPSSV